MPDKKIHVYESSDNEYRIEPVITEMNRTNADVLQIRNHSNDDMLVYFPSGSFNNATPHIKPLPAKSITPVPNPALQAVNSTLYTYQIINPKNGRKAKANSDPILIIEN